MAYTFIARMKAFPDKEAQFIDTCQRMEMAVLEHEPDTVLYKLYQLRKPNSFAVTDSSSTESGDKVHQDSEHFKPIVPDMIECLDGGYVHEFLDQLK